MIVRSLAWDSANSVMAWCRRPWKRRSAMELLIFFNVSATLVVATSLGRILQLPASDAFMLTAWQCEPSPCLSEAHHLDASGGVQPHGQTQRWEHQSLDSLFNSLTSLFFGKAARAPPDHAHFLATQTSVLDRHAEKRVLFVLIVSGKRILVENHQFRTVGAHPCKVWEFRSDHSDQGSFSLHSFVIGQRAKRIADPGYGRIPQVEQRPMQLPFDRCSAYVRY